MKHTPSSEDVPPSYNRKRWVPGLASVDAGLRWPYPVSIYQIEGDDTSGLVGTLWPDGAFTRLDETRVPREVRYWDHETHTSRAGTVVWDSNVAGSVEIDPRGGPHRRTFDASLMGDWPNHRPRPTNLATIERIGDAHESWLKQKRTEQQ